MKLMIKPEALISDEVGQGAEVVYRDGPGLLMVGSCGLTSVLC